MVSFSCEVCNDTIIKKKLDQHSQRCYGAYFSCIDCSTTFQGVEYRGHTSCISEAEKYEKALYKGKKSVKADKKPAEAKPKEAKVPEVKAKEAEAPVVEPKAKDLKKDDSTSVLSKYLKSNKHENLYKIIKKASKENSKEIKDFLKSLEIVKNEEGKIVLK